MKSLSLLIRMINVSSPEKILMLFDLVKNIENPFTMDRVVKSFKQNYYNQELIATPIQPLPNKKSKWRKYFN